MSGPDRKGLGAPNRKWLEDYAEEAREAACHVSRGEEPAPMLVAALALAAAIDRQTDVLDRAIRVAADLPRYERGDEDDED